MKKVDQNTKALTKTFENIDLKIDWIKNKLMKFTNSIHQLNNLLEKKNLGFLFTPKKGVFEHVLNFIESFRQQI